MPDGLEIVLLLLGAFLAGIVTGLTGFGTALTAMALWLYAIPPVLAVPLVAFCSLASHFFTLRKIWPHMDFCAAWPFVVGGIIGIPAGVWLLIDLSPETFKLAVGILLIGFPLYMLLAREPFLVSSPSRAIESLVGIVSGLCGGFAGLSGPVLVVWSQLCQWSKQQARSVLQLINMSVLMVAILAYTARGLVSADLFVLVGMCLPATLAGSWIGLKLYQRIDQDSFKRVVLVLLMASGLGLTLPRLL